MDTSDRDITFDEEGRCNHCCGFLARTVKRSYRGEESRRELAAIVRRITGAARGRRYDSVIGISGGLDSVFDPSPCTWTMAGTRPQP
jgi:aminotransferase